jgi:electron transfer flavoprotein alpha subunit
MTSHKSILILGETTEDDLSTATKQAFRIGKELATACHSALNVSFLADTLQASFAEAYAYGVDKVFALIDPAMAVYSADAFMQAIIPLITELKPAVVLMGHTDIGQDLAPRLAFRLGTGAVLDCVDILTGKQEDALIYEKPVFGGKAHGRIRLAERYPHIITIREGAWDNAERQEERTGEVMPTALSLDPTALRTRHVKKEPDQNLAMAVRLAGADTVVCAGRGVKNQTGVDLIAQTADLVDAAVAATRPVVDNHWLPYSLQVGLTGKKINPRLYLAVGVSGAVQHMAGCLKSKTIAAINTDEAAPIFRMAQIGVVGDCKDVLAGFNDEIKKMEAVDGSR